MPIKERLNRKKLWTLVIVLIALVALAFLSKKVICSSLQTDLLITCAYICYGAYFGFLAGILFGLTDPVLNFIQGIIGGTIIRILMTCIGYVLWNSSNLLTNWTITFICFACCYLGVTAYKILETT